MPLKCRAVTMRRCKKSKRAIGTQTESPYTNPVVVLNRLSSSTIRRLADQSESGNITIRNPSLITAAAQPAVSRAPRNYRFFAQPITNNQRANSTPMDLDADKNAEKTPKKRVRFNKPGPLCSKRLSVREELDVPLARSEASSADFPPPDCLLLNLDTVIEHTELAELTQFAEEVVLEQSGQSEARKESAVLRSLEEAGQEAPHPPGDRGEHMPSGNSSQEHEWASKGKHVLIKADIVNIYNHFYNGV